MLTIYGNKQRMCDGVSRRDFLKIGGFAMGAAGGIGLPEILRAQSASGKRSQHKAVIHIFLGGGPPHQDMWEIKTEAPKEIRGEFQPIATKVPGIQIGECFPKLAAMMDKLIVIRSVVGSDGSHDAYQCLSGCSTTTSWRHAGWWRRESASSRWHTAAGTGTAVRTAPTSRTPAIISPRSIRASPPCSTTCGLAGWKTTSR